MIFVAKLSVLKKTLNFLGYDHVTGKRDVRVYLFVLSFFLILTNTLCLVVYKWDDTGKSVNGLKSVIYYLTLGCYSFVFIFNWNDMILALRTVEADRYPVPYRCTPKRAELLRVKSDEMIESNTFWRNGIFTYLLLGVTIPFLSIVVNLLTKKLRDISVTNFILPYPFYYPERHETLPVYLAGNIVQTIFHVGSTQYAYYTTTTSLLSMLVVESELTLLRLSVEEMDEGLLVARAADADPRQTDSHHEDSTDLKLFIRYVVNHHQYIFRKAREVTKGIQLTAFILNSGVSVYICMGIYFIVESDGLIFKLQEVITCFLWAYGIYCYDYIGERIAIECDKLRRATYDYAWIDKPQWFKKSLHIIMTRTTKPIEIKPVGLFVLNLKNFATFGNAAYSYYSVLSNAKK